MTSVLKKLVKAADMPLCERHFYVVVDCLSNSDTPSHSCQSKTPIKKWLKLPGGGANRSRGKRGRYRREEKTETKKRVRECVCVCVCAWVEVCAEKSQSLTPFFIPLQQIRAIMCEQGKDRPAEFPQGQKGLQLLHFHQVNCDVTHLPYGAKIGTPLSHVGMTP